MNGHILKYLNKTIMPRFKLNEIEKFGQQSLYGNLMANLLIRNRFRMIPPNWVALGTTSYDVSNLMEL